MASNLFNAVDEKRTQLGFDALSDAERVLTCISWAWFEIEIGGFYQFFHNSSGGFGKETVWAFEQVGAEKIADIFRRACEIFDDGAPPRDQLERFKALEDAGKRFDVDQLLDNLTNEFYAYPQTNMDELLDAFVERHREELPLVGE